MFEDDIDYSEPIPERNIILIGLMGSGKSTVAKELGKILTYPVLDTDDHIEQIEERTIPEIFEQEGEDYFRACEKNLVQTMVDASVQKHIIATGGGLPTNKHTQGIIKKLGFVVWLSTDVSTLHERTSTSNNRPLLAGENPKKVLTQLLEDREVDYKRCSHLMVKTSNLSINDVACGILESARFYFSKRLAHKESNGA